MERIGERLTIAYTGEEIDIGQLFDVKVVKTKNGKRVRIAKPTIKCYFQSSEGPSERPVKEKGEYYIKIEWNMDQENLDYGSAIMSINITVQ